MNNPAAGARALAASVVARILQEGVTLDSALQQTLVDLPANLKSATRSLCYGAVRGYFRHEAILAKLLSQPVRSLDSPVRALLSVALFELEDGRTPEYAVVDAAVKTTKAGDAARASGLVNAVLRRYLRERDLAHGRDRAQSRHSPRLADMAGRPLSRRLAGEVDAIAGGRGHAGAHVAARQRPRCHRGIVSRDAAGGRTSRPRRAARAAGRGARVPLRRA